MFINIYNTLLRILYPLVITPYIQHRKTIGKEDISRFHERLGRPQQERPEGKLIWFHGASVGESISMLPLIKRLLEIYPDIRIMVTTGTRTSADVMAKRLPERAFHQYLPIDNPSFTARFLDHWKPDLILWFESDFWPAMLSGIKRRNIPLILVNGRISDKSFKRWQKFVFISRELLSCFTLCLGQSEEDARRLHILGARTSLCLGNLKYAGLPIPVDENEKNKIISLINSRPVWLASSTHHNEEEQIGNHIREIQQAVPGVLTIIVPRHPHRGPEIKETLDTLGLKTGLRSAKDEITPDTEVYIADTIGELGIWYNIAPVVFVGGSLIPHGGQNFMEPSRMRDAVIVGPHMHNFTDAINRAKKADAVIQVKDAAELRDSVIRLLGDSDFLETRRRLACNWAEAENRVLDGILEKVKGYIKA